MTLQDANHDGGCAFGLIDLLEAAVSVGYRAGLRGETKEDAAEIGEYVLAQIVIEGRDDFRDAMDAYQVPALKFTDEWRSVIVDMLSISKPGWITARSSHAEPLECPLH